VDGTEDFRSFAESRPATYVNYRYYPELLETAILPREDANAIIRAREDREGEQFGMTLFGRGDEEETHYDNWPLASYARGLLELGERRRFHNALVGHALHHQTHDTFTAYEQVTQTGDPRRCYADWCVPCQLVLPRMLAWSFRYRAWDGSSIEGNGPDMEMFDDAIKRHRVP
jgi:hypothetical protein